MDKYVFFFFLKALHSEVLSLEPAHAELVSLGTSLYLTAPDERVRQLKDELEALQGRLHVQNEALPQRYNKIVYRKTANIFTG